MSRKFRITAILDGIAISLLSIAGTLFAVPGGLYYISVVWFFLVAAVIYVSVMLVETAWYDGGIHAFDKVRGIFESETLYIEGERCRHRYANPTPYQGCWECGAQERWVVEVKNPWRDA